MTAPDDSTLDLARRVGSLEAKFEMMRGIVDRSDSDESGVPDVYWVDFPDSEKWRVAWGTWWRMAVVMFALYAAIILVAMAAFAIIDR